MKKECKNCIHFYESDDENHKHYSGICKCFPEHKIVHLDDFCGQFKKKEQSDDK